MNSEKIDPGFWIGLVFVWLLIAVCSKCHAQETQKAQYDTIPCKVECIQKFVQKQTPKSIRIYAVYIDKTLGIADVISVSKSVYEYIEQCKSYGIRPSLGLKLRNREVYSIIKIKKRL